MQTYQVNEQDFWLEKPMMMGLRGWSLLIPAAASSIGFFCFAVLAFSFTELATLPAEFRMALVLVGSFSLAFGSEVGTLSSVVEIYRKGERLGRWDKLALLISVLSTVGAFVLAFATLLGVKATWGVVVQLYGPVVLGLLAALDSYGGFMEFGLYLNGFDKRMQSWQRQFSDFKREHLTQQLDAQRQLTAQRVKVQLAQLGGPVVQTVSNTETTGQGEPVQDAAPLPLASETTTQLEQARQARLDNKRQRLDTLLDIYRQDSDAGASSVAKQLNISRSTLYNYLDELEKAGAVRRNGEGVQVLN
ncbi:MAG TPA: HTH domain-containing protein [Anaerolineae bacterium]|nr:HTH domain-containing protein [Anaerolineae bacterium]